jgi:hypothetical protein
MRTGGSSVEIRREPERSPTPTPTRMRVGPRTVGGTRACIDAATTGQPSPGLRR